MTYKTADISPLLYARVAGLLYLIMVPLGFFANYGPSMLFVPGDAAATVSNIMASETTYRLSIMSALVVQIVQILMVLVLYRLLKPVNTIHAVLMLVFILVAVPIAMLNEVHQFAVLMLLGGADYLTVFKTNQVQAQVMLFLDMHKHGLNIAFLFWGLWLFPMGYLVYKSGFIPKILGILVIIGCFGYLTDSIAFFFFPNFKPIIMYTFWGELLLALWLVIKGVDVEQWKKCSAESA